MIPPVEVFWDGEALVPVKRFKKICQRHFIVGECHRMVEEHERSTAMHNSYFAAVTEGWQNLPEALGQRYRTPEHLRKAALIEAGFCDTMTHLSNSKAEALRVGILMSKRSPFDSVAVRGNMVTIKTAHSQSRRAMGPKQFSESKKAVLLVISKMIGTDVETLKENAGKAA